MSKRGEVQRVRKGVNPNTEENGLVGDSPVRERGWRFVRTAKPGWTCKDASLKTGVSLTHVLRFCDWLEQEGFIQAVGRQGTARTFRATQKALQSPEMPQPPSQEPNPFEKECRAAGKIVNLLLYHNPYSPKVAKELARCGEVILARFGSQNEKSNQVEKKEQAT